MQLAQNSTLRTIFFLGLFVCLIATQYTYESYAAHRGVLPLSNLPAPVLKVTDLGLNSAVASLLWLNVVQNVVLYFGASSATISSDINAVTQLDPKFSYPYAFAVLMIPGFDRSQTQAAIDIATRGVDEHLTDWRIPYYLGFTYFFYLKDNANAIKYMHITAETPGVPAGIKVTALNYGLSKTMHEQTRQFWQSIHDSATDDVVRQNAQDNLDHMDIVEGLQAALELYKRIHGAYPKAIGDLVTSGILTSIPEDPFGITFATDGEGHLTFSLGQ